jgi:hypothetical protein
MKDTALAFVVLFSVLALSAASTGRKKGVAAAVAHPAAHRDLRPAPADAFAEVGAGQKVDEGAARRRRRRTHTHARAQVTEGALGHGLMAQVKQATSQVRF